MNARQLVKGRRSILAILTIALISMTCSIAYYEPVFLGTVTDWTTQQPVDSVLVWISVHELVDPNVEDYSRWDGGYPTPSDSNGQWRSELSIANPGGCSGKIDGPAGVEQFYFRFEREGYLTLDTMFSGEQLEQNRIKCDVFQVPDIGLVADTTN